MKFTVHADYFVPSPGRVMEITMKSQTESKKKNMITLTVTGSIIILIALILVFFVGFFPSISAKSDFSKKVDAVDEGNIKAATVFSPNAPSGIFQETDVEKVFYETDELRSLFLSASEKVSFAESGKELSPSDYKYRIRFITDEGTFDFFLKSGKIYISEDGIRHYFLPKNADAFDKLLDHLDSVFEIKRP